MRSLKARGGGGTGGSTGGNNVTAQGVAKWVPRHLQRQQGQEQALGAASPDTPLGPGSFEDAGIRAFSSQRAAHGHQPHPRASPDAEAPKVLTGVSPTTPIAPEAQRPTSFQSIMASDTLSNLYMNNSEGVNSYALQGPQLYLETHSDPDIANAVVRSLLKKIC